MNSLNVRVPTATVAGAAKLSQLEAKIFQFLQAGVPMSIDRLTDLVGSRSREDIAKKSITVTIKMMAHKIAPYGYQITMVEGGRGRGKKGVYKLERIK